MSEIDSGYKFLCAVFNGQASYVKGDLFQIKFYVDGNEVDEAYSLQFWDVLSPSKEVLYEKCPDSLWANSWLSCGKTGRVYLTALGYGLMDDFENYPTPDVSDVWASTVEWNRLYSRSRFEGDVAVAFWEAEKKRLLLELGTGISKSAREESGRCPMVGCQVWWEWVMYYFPFDAAEYPSWWVSRKENA